MWLTLFLWVVTFVLSELLRPKPKQERLRPANLGDFTFPTATQGRIVPLVWGTVRLEGPNVVWYGDLKQIAITEKVKTGIFSSEEIITGYEYHVGVQMALCRGPIDKLLKVWVEDNLVWTTGLTAEGTVVLNLPNLFGGQKLGTGGIIGTSRWHVGNETQNANAYLSAFQQQGGDTPAYRGTSHFVLENVYVGTSTSIQPWRFEVQRIPNGLALGTPGVNSGLDANPMNVAYELFTNTDWGLAFAVADIDVPNFQAAAATLLSEGNGFSFILDSPIETSDFLKEIERQIDGVFVFDKSTGKWKVTLARSGYDINTIPQANSSNIVSVESYSRGAWDETTNEVRINFSRRGNFYVEDFASAQDGANIRVQGGQVVSTQMNFPGVKHAALANSIAWRTLRGLSRPLAKAALVVDRSFYTTNPGDVIAWTDDPLGLVKLAVRVTKVDLGELADGKITLQVVEDIFNFKAASAGDPVDSNWTTPPDGVVDISLVDRVVFEAPKAFVDRDPVSPGLARRIWFAAREQADQAVLIELEVAGAKVGSVGGFLLAGKLSAQLNPTAQGTTVTLLPDPDGTLAMLNLIESASADDIGVSLSNIILIEDEFLGFLSAGNVAGNLQLNTVYRALLDTVPAIHLINTRVWLLFINGNITDKSFSTSPISIKPIPVSYTTRLASGSATANSVTIQDRHLLPYPPNNINIGGVLYQSSTSLDNVSGGGDDGKGVNISYTRRDYRTLNEVKAALDETSLPADFPTANTTQYQVDVYDITSGTTFLYSSPWLSANSNPLSRTEILRYTAGVIPTNLRIILKTRHTVSGTVYAALQNFSWDFAVSSALLAGAKNWAILTNGLTSTNYNAPSTGTYVFTIGSNVLGSGKVEASINGGAFATVIATGTTSGNLVGVVAADTIRVRHTQPGSTAVQSLLLVTPPSGQKAYGILVI